MVYEESLLDAVEDQVTAPLAGIVFRFTFAGQPPLRPNVRGARWNPPDTAALYTSREEATARAEIDYLIGLQPVPPRARLSLARIHVTLTRVVDLCDDRLLRERFALDLSALRDDVSGHQPCRELGGAAAFLGRSGILVPSLRRAGAVNLVVFTTNLNPEEEVLELTSGGSAG